MDVVNRIETVVGWSKLKVSRSRGQYRHMQKRGGEAVKVRTKPKGGSIRAIECTWGRKNANDGLTWTKMVLCPHYIVVNEHKTYSCFVLSCCCCQPSFSVSVKSLKQLVVIIGCWYS